MGQQGIPPLQAPPVLLRAADESDPGRNPSFSSNFRRASGRVGNVLLLERRRSDLAVAGMNLGTTSVRLARSLGLLPSPLTYSPSLSLSHVPIPISLLILDPPSFLRSLSNNDPISTLAFRPLCF